MEERSIAKNLEKYLKQNPEMEVYTGEKRPEMKADDPHKHVATCAIAWRSDGVGEMHGPGIGVWNGF